jgi:hypothetical protein
LIKLSNYPLKVGTQPKKERRLKKRRDVKVKNPNIPKMDNIKPRQPMA